MPTKSVRPGNCAHEMQKENEAAAQRLDNDKAEFNSRLISFDELRAENITIKLDLKNLDIHVRKLQLDHELGQQSQQQIDEKSNALAGIFLKDNVKWISSNLNPTNFANSKTKLQKVVERCREIGFKISQAEEAQLFSDLKQGVRTCRACRL